MPEEPYGYGGRAPEAFSNIPEAMRLDAQQPRAMRRGSLGEPEEAGEDYLEQLARAHGVIHSPGGYPGSPGGYPGSPGGYPGSPMDNLQREMESLQRDTMFSGNHSMERRAMDQAYPSSPMKSPMESLQREMEGLQRTCSGSPTRATMEKMHVEQAYASPRESLQRTCSGNPNRIAVEKMHMEQELLETKRRLENAEAMLQRSEKERSELELDRLGLQHALSEEREIRCAMQQKFQDRLEPRGEQKAAVLTECLEQAMGEQEELAEKLQCAINMFQRERAARIEEQEECEQVNLAYRMKHMQYREVLAQYEEVLSQLAMACAAIDQLQEELSHSEWTSEALHDRLQGVVTKLGENGAPDAFSLKKITQDVKDSIAEACKLPVVEKKKALRDMRMRWHPDKNGMLKELAADVFKIINDELLALENAEKAKDKETIQTPMITLDTPTSPSVTAESA